MKKKTNIHIEDKENILTPEENENVQDAAEETRENDPEEDVWIPDVQDAAEETEEDDPGSDETGNVKILTAVWPILYLSHQYKVGEALPAGDPDMVDAWISAGTAVWKSVGQQKQIKVRPATAEPGLQGKTETSDNDLIGKVPRTIGRKRK